MSGRSLRGLLVVALATLAVAAPARAASSVLDNGRIRIAVDLSSGGRISWLSQARGAHVENLVADSEQAYSFGGSQQTARVAESRNDGHTLYVRSYDEGSGSSFQTWITLDGPAARIRQRVTTVRWGDPARWWQEVPPVYSGEANTRVVTYDGDIPFRHDGVRDITELANYPLYGPNHYGAMATEHWIALVGQNDFGVGLVEPDVSNFIAIAQPRRAYVAGVRYEQLDTMQTYEYSYALVVGSVAQIRAYAYAHRPDERPNFVFAHDRQHFTLQNTTDFGWPISGAIRVHLDENAPILDGPEQRFQARAVPRLYIRGAWHSHSGLAQVFWAQPGRYAYEFTEEQSRKFKVLTDGFFHTYRVDLFRTPTYSGTIASLRLDPTPGSDPGGWADITCISYKPCPVDRRAEARMLDQPRTPYVDSFDRLDSTFWSISGNSTGAQAQVRGGVLELSIAHDAVPLPGQDYVGTGVYSRCAVGGDFVAQVSYVLEKWPAGNTAHVSFNANDKTIYRSSDYGEQIGTWFPPFGTNVVDDRTDGTVRFERTGGTLYGEFLNEDGQWQPLGTANVAGDVHLSISLYSNKPNADVEAAFDNFRITRGRLTCP
jgi:hypothetical protein